jgi:NAD(P)-dependent dehydrogenase (short-subunit alcohol dehydrogenase family)
VPADGPMSGTSVIVTGAAGGIGAAAAARLAADGARVTAVDIDAAKLGDVVAALPGSHHRACAADLTDLSCHDEIVRAAVLDSGRLAGLAHLAAVLHRAESIYDVSEKEWDAQLNVNLKATFFLNRAVARLLVAQKAGGAIVNFTSQAWWTGGFGGNIVYAASKGGVVSMSRNLARTLAPDGIRVNTIAPGFVETEMMLGGLGQDEVESFRKMVPLGRMATPAEIAGAVSFLLGTDSAYITGATLNVTGGQLMY